MVQPLLRLLHTSKEVERVVVASVLAVSRSAPVCYSRHVVARLSFVQNLFSPFYHQFLLRTDDLRQVKQDKIKVLLVLANFDTHQAVLREFIVSLFTARIDLIQTFFEIGLCR